MPYRLVDALSHFNDPSLSYNREVACFVDPNFGVVDISTDNSGGHVDFNFHKIWEHIKAMDYAHKLSEVWMIHSHPTGFNHFSSMDHSMKKGWALGLAIPINFAIVTDGQYRLVNISYDRESKSVNETGNSHGFYSRGIHAPASDLDPKYISQLFDIIWGLSIAPEDGDSDFESLVQEINFKYPPNYYSVVDLVERSWFELVES